MSFSLHFHAMRGRPGHYLKSEEFRFYVGLIGTATVIMFLYNISVYDHQGTKLYVSEGTGFWGPPMRLFTRSEITLLTLRAPK